MAGIEGLLGRSVYLDTNVFVYAVEGFARHRAFIPELFREFEAGHASAVTSELTLAEALVKPLEIDRQDIARRDHSAKARLRTWRGALRRGQRRMLAHNPVGGNRRRLPQEAVLALYACGGLMASSAARS
jgi:predicted nucleic acid-binding protein